ncbi:MAG: hypothetical protein EOM50_11255 [Erysipelotrichia bacterium]|nr:hypothetical protein [Erysipelotrichia bacterium]NCC54223.1 hypothetical protein [Erysipelotrichia bacterium]
MKKILTILLMALLLVGCQFKTKETSNASVDQKEDLKFGLTIANSEDGSYMMATKTSNSIKYKILYFYDKATDTLVPLCHKNNCEHNDMDCSAFQLGTIENNEQIYKVFSMIFYKDRLYLAYIGITGNTPVLIQSVAKDGTDLRKEYESNELGMINTFNMYQDKLIVSKGFFGKDATGNIVGSSTINAVLCYDLTTKKETYIANEEKIADRMVYLIGMKDRLFYYADINMQTNVNEVFLYQMEDGKTKLVSNNAEKVSVAYDGYFYYLNANNEVIKQGIDAKENSLFLQLDEQPLFFYVSPQGYLTYYNQNSEGDTYMQIIDLTSKKSLFAKPKKNMEDIGRNLEYYFLQDNENKLYRYDIKRNKTEELN